jgi:hypothetical protein
MSSALPSFTYFSYSGTSVGDGDWLERNSLEFMTELNDASLDKCTFSIPSSHVSPVRRGLPVAHRP